MKKVLLLLIFIACTPMVDVQPSKPPVITSFSVREPVCDIEACNSDSDCCEGFYCGSDPEKNKYKKYCLYSGK
jgi:hypothetical protein